MSDLAKYMKNVTAVSGRLSSPGSNEPSQYGNRGYPYLGTAGARFYQEYAKYATDYFVNVPAQGLDPEDFQAWETVTLRMADQIKISAGLQSQFDNFKMVLLDRQRYAYVPRGAKFVCMGSTWLCTNPQNISCGDGMGVVQRCNVTWNHLDWYGNLLKEPMAYSREILRANAPDPEYSMNVMKGYFDIRCQYNEQTSQIDDNTRFIFGRNCYVVSGFSDNEQEFTGDYSRVHLLEFTVRKDEVNDVIDDLENHVAGGKTFSWEIGVAGLAVVAAGEMTVLTAVSTRCGETMESTEEHPISYFWETSDESVATVDDDGTVTGVAEGTCEITVTLGENPSVSNTFTLTVAGDETQDMLGFSPVPVEELRAYQSVTIQAVKYLGVNASEFFLRPYSTLYPYEELYPEEEAELSWAFSGADERSYTVSVDGDEATISCWSGSVEPLTVTVTLGDVSVSTEIRLRGI